MDPKMVLRMLCFCIMLGFCMAELVPDEPLILPYHNGPVLTGPAPINVYVIFYGSFSRLQRATIRAFLHSFDGQIPENGTSTVAGWWGITKGYIDSTKKGVSQQIKLAGEIQDRKYSAGKNLKPSGIESIIVNALKSKVFPTDNKGIYLVLTAADVLVEKFCMSTCGQHAYIFPGSNTKGQMLPYAWVGDSTKQCTGFCAWPYAKPLYGPKTEPLKAPNDVGTDGMIITIAKVLAGAATNPYNTAYYQGDAAAALEAAGACSAAYGKGSYPGYPGDLLMDKNGASYNVQGWKNYKFLVPWIWNPATLACAGQI